MKHSRVLVLTTLIAASAASCAQHVGDDTESTEQPAGFVFPDLYLPRESCDLGISLECPAEQRYTLRHLTDLRTLVQTTSTFTRPMKAIVDRTAISCRPTDFVTTAFSGAVFLPNDVTATVTQNRASVVFSKQIPDETGKFVCGFDCTPDGPAPRGCGQSGLRKTHFEGALTVNGETRNVQLTSQVDGNPTPDPSTRRLEVHCKLTLPGSSMATNSRRRPDDILSASENRFVRGYELTGAALTSACSRLANMTCQPAPGERHLDGLGECIQSHTDSCVSTFSNADPCVPRPIPVIR